MATVKATLSPAPSISSKIVFTIYNTLTPTVEAATRIVKDPPHPIPYTFQFSNLPDGTYIVKVNASADGIVLGALMHDFWIDAATNTILFARKFYHVDGANAWDPVSGQNILADSALNGNTVTGVFQEGFRYLEDAVEWVPHAGGGIELQGGNIFSAGQVWSIEYVIPVSASVAVTPAPFSDIVFPLVSFDLDATYFNKSILAQPSGSAIVITNPFLATMADGSGFIIRHEGGLGNAPYVEYRMKTGELIRFMGQDTNYIYLGVGEWIKVIKKGSRMYVTDHHGQWGRVGERIGCDENARPNMLYAGNPATVYDGTIYKRIYDYIENELPSGLKVTMSDYNTTFVAPSPDGGTYYLNRGKYAIDTVAKTFKLPDMTGKSMKFESSGPGSYQHDNVGPHEHDLITVTSGSHSSASPLVTGNGHTLANPTHTGGSASGLSLVGAKVKDTVPRSPNAVRGILMYPMILI